MTAQELKEDAIRYIKEAWAEWLDNAEDSPPSHIYTALVAIGIYLMVKAWVF